jgi:transposase
MLAPLVRRTWAPLGQTPVLVNRTRGQRKVSLIAALCLSPALRSIQLFFQILVKGNFNGEVVIGFLGQLRRQVRGPINLVWDLLQAHRCQEVRRYLQHVHRVMAWYLPPYAPELNPVEYAWCYLKMNPLANLAPPNAPALGKIASRRGRSLARRKKLLRSFVMQSPLFSCHR